MKTKPKETPKTTSATVTSTAKLTIQGQMFEMPLAELEDLYSKIGAALGKRTDASDMEKIRKMYEESIKGRERDRNRPPLSWPTVPPYVPPHNHPQRHPYPWGQPILCRAEQSFSANACDIQQDKHTDQRDRF